MAFSPECGRNYTRRLPLAACYASARPHIPTDLLPPSVLGPLVQCDTSLSFQQVTAGAALMITNGGQGEAWINSGASYKTLPRPRVNQRQGRRHAVDAAMPT